MTPEREVELFAKLELLLELYRRGEADAAAMRSEMSQLRSDVRMQMDGFRTEMDNFRSEMRAEMDGFRTEMDNFRSEMRADLREVKAEVRELRTAQQEANARLSRVEGRIEEQSKFLQSVLASRQTRRAAG